VPGHRAGVAQAEVDETVPVQIDQLGTARAVEVERKAAGPHPHPRHRHATEQMGGPALECRP